MGQTSFVHYHMGNNGKLVSHSHPYKIPVNKSNSGHSHTAAELLIFSLFDGGLPDFMELMSIREIVVNVLQFEYNSYVIQSSNSYYHNKTIPRGPPTFIL